MFFFIYFKFHLQNLKQNRGKIQIIPITQNHGAATIGKIQYGTGTKQHRYNYKNFCGTVPPPPLLFFWLFRVPPPLLFFGCSGSPHFEGVGSNSGYYCKYINFPRKCFQL